MAPAPKSTGALSLLPKPEGLQVCHEVGTARRGLHFLVDLDYLAFLGNVEGPA